ncbi:MAG TPA: type 1 glutamine amidotransferase [Myxococcota bacterium]|nr:type 1 glutamine amidotransferase [Myxococcota bacterium]
MSIHPRALLVSLRDPHDPMAHHERACFAAAARIDVDRLDVHAMIDGPLDPASIVGRDAVFFGGSGAFSVLDDVAWIRDGLVALQRVIDARAPAWASCFGFQGLALALGGEVIHDDARTELGATRLELTDEGRADPLVGTLPARFWAQEGHHDHVVRLPPGVTRLARGEAACEQAFKVDGAPFWASQFHPELDPDTTVHRFLHYLELYFTGSRAEADAMLHHLRSGEQTPEVPALLARLVRGEF